MAANATASRRCWGADCSYVSLMTGARLAAPAPAAAAAPDATQRLHEAIGRLGGAIPVSRVVVFDDAGRTLSDSAPHAGDDGAVSAAVARMLPGLRAAQAGAIAHRDPRLDADAVLRPPVRMAWMLGDGRLHLLVVTPVWPRAGAAGRPGAVVAALSPLDARALSYLADGYLIDGLHVETAPGRAPYDVRLNDARLNDARLAVRDADGRAIAWLAWHAESPGGALARALVLPAIVFFGLFLLIAWRFARQSATIASDLIASEAHARHLAYHDTLTQMPNRALMFDRLRLNIAQIRRTGAMVAVHCLDLDRFKDVNDTLGHQAGDELIQKVCARLVEMCRDSDTVARLGGDEFVILQPNTTASGASHLAQRVLASFKDPFELTFGIVEVGCSIGVTLIESADMDANEALRQADMSLYGSKDAGRNRVTFFEPDMDAALRMRRSLETDLRKALHGDALNMVYQPQIDSRGHIASMEALVRWEHPERGLIPPAMFVPLAEESGLILDLGEFVFRRVFQETKDWGDVRVAVNVSALQLRSMSFMAMLTRLVAEHRIDVSKYEIEITETALLGDDCVTRDNITMLKQEGFTIALDDFGTGYSSLSSLQRFAVDKIKIDRSFVRSLEAADEEAEALVDAIVKLGRALKLNIVAEGVETEHQRERLLHCGCNHFQGYLISRPVSAGDIEKMLA